MKSKFIYAITLVLGLSLFPFYAKAQNWQAYKGVWLKGYDNAAQAPVPPSGYSALTYFADSLGTYVYDWDSLAWLRIPGVGSGGGGGGGLVTASNMLSVSPAGNVIAGGVATHDTYNHLGLNSITWSSPTAKIHIPRAESVFPFRQSLYITAGDTSDNAVNNNARLILEDVPVDIPRAELRAGINASNSGRIVAEPNSARLQLNTGQISVEVTSTQSAMKHNNVQFAIQGGNHWATLSESGRSTFRTTLNTNEVLTEVTTASDNLRMTTASGAIILDDEIVFPQITENTNLTDSVMMLDGDGRIFWKTISGGGGGITNTSAINELPKTIDGSGNLATSGIESTTAGSLNLGLSGTSGNTRTIAFQGSEANGQIVIQAKGAGGQLRVNNTVGGGRLFVGNSAVTNDNIISVEDAEGAISLSTEHASGSYPAQLALRGDNDDLMIHAGSGRQLNILGSGIGSIINIDVGSGMLQILNIPTTDPCGSAPTGTVWSDSGTLKVCP